jgi:branched-chain amino acid transport system substrate-binding protein
MPDVDLPLNPSSSPEGGFSSKPSGQAEAFVPPPASAPPPTVPQEASSKNFPLLFVLLAAIFFLGLGVLAAQFLNFTSLLPVFPNRISASPSPLVASGELKIGGILPLTGDGAAYGVPIQKAAILAQKEINESGGIKGRKIKFIWKDGQCEKTTAKAAAEQLVNEESVEFLLGGACSDEFLASAPIAQAKKVVVFSTTATSPKISELGRYVFRTCPSDTLAGKAAAGYAFQKWGAKTAAVIAENTDYSLALKEVFSENFSKLGGKVVLAETFNSNNADFASVSARVKNLNPDVLYLLPQTSTPGVLLVKALKAQGITSKILTAEVLLSRELVAEQGKVLEGVTGIETLFDETRPKTKAFLELYKKEYNLEPSYPADVSGVYDFLYLIKAAYEAGAKNPDEVADWLYQVRQWEGALGVLEFDFHGDPKLAYSIRQISGSAAPQVDTYAPSP